jgi:hypothetical protein
MKPAPVPLKLTADTLVKYWPVTTTLLLVGP